MREGREELLAEGTRLLAERRFFEAHEAWETAWRRAEGPRRELLQGLVQVAAACHHLQRNRRRQARTLLERARSHLQSAGSAATGVDVQALLGALDRLEEFLSLERPVTEVPWPSLPMEG